MQSNCILGINYSLLHYAFNLNERLLRQEILSNNCLNVNVHLKVQELLKVISHFIQMLWGTIIQNPQLKYPIVR